MKNTNTSSTDFATPILYIVFNRLDYTEKSLAVLRELKPKKLYIAADGPRESKPGENEIVAAVRKYVSENIDWECDVKTRFLNENQGCGKNISGAVTWFFEQEKQGIILEDDCIPDMSFFRFCAEMLERYRDDRRVYSVNGWSASQDGTARGADYFFQRRMHCWGWATWADRWLNKFQFDMSGYSKSIFKYIADMPNVRKEFEAVLENLKSDAPIDTWAYRWTFNIIAGRGLCVAPVKNLVSNIGITGAHYDDASDDPNLNTKTFDTYAAGLLRHPKSVKLNAAMERAVYDDHRPPPIDWARLWRHLKWWRK
ncbi:MAG: nucleotide-diphospho-sugar transferase [Proteobacteria bacterium]|nr:nucleotide-diphospho-sugar transferase [Pseudomonadota bacterium]